MKSTIFTLLLAILTIGVSAQVQEDLRLMAYGKQNAFMLEVEDLDNRYVEKEWKEFMKDYGRFKKVKKADEYVIENAQILDIGGASKIDVFYVVEKTGKESARLITWFAKGADYISSESDPSGYAGVVKLVQNFDHHLTIRQIEDELEVQEKEMKKMDSKMSKLQKDNENYHKEIEKAKERILKNEDNIVKNIEDQELAQKEIEMQQQLVDDVKARLNEARENKSGGSE